MFRHCRSPHSRRASTDPSGEASTRRDRNDPRPRLGGAASQEPHRRTVGVVAVTPLALPRAPRCFTYFHAAPRRVYTRDSSLGEIARSFTISKKTFAGWRYGHRDRGRTRASLTDRSALQLLVVHKSLLFNATDSKIASTTLSVLFA